MSSASNYRVVKSTQRTQTCDTCKSRHQKCSGAQPQCNNCELRGINCTYSKRSSTAEPSSQSHKATASPSPSAGIDLQRSISTTEYARLYSQIFNDIVRDFNLDAVQTSGVQTDDFVRSGPCNASLSSFLQEVYHLVEQQNVIENGESTPESAQSQMRELAMDRNLDNARKILRDSLPSQGTSQRLLDLFFNYQNSVFYICNLNEAQTQLNRMYEEPGSVSLSWFCQMYLIFSVAVQFDDLDDTDEAIYHDIGKKYMDDAIEEDSQNTLWVIRAMLLLCFYQAPTKWASIWIYLDAAIRGAQRFQLDVGQNQLKEVSDEEYQDWRQLWLTTISFDRWVAIFLGRLPRIKESISKDPIFKESPFKPNSGNCIVQNYITSLAIISGNILRDMYFSEEFPLSICQQYKNELDKWITSLPNPLQQHVERGDFSGLPKEETESAFNLHFMHLGAWMLLTRPLLLKALKTRMSPTNFAGPILSAIKSDAGACIEYAFQLIKSASTNLVESLPPKRVFMPIYFLVNAANIVVLGAVWKRKQSSKGGYSRMMFDESRELAAVDAATRVLDFCGQRNAFARKHSILLKGLRQQLIKCLPSPVSDALTPNLAAGCVNPNFSESYNRFKTWPSQSSPDLDSTPKSSTFQTQRMSVSQTNQADFTRASTDMIPEHSPSGASLNPAHELWSEESGIFYPPSDILPYDSVHSLQYNDDMMSFLDEQNQ